MAKLYTAIVSDLHLCESEPVNKRFPLWKKYKTKEFFFDGDFVAWLRHLEKLAGGKTIELILNGDIFDFDSLTSRPKNPEFFISWLETRRGLNPQQEKSVYKINRILKDHDVWVNGLKDFLGHGHRVVFVIGNHDLELHFPEVQKYILDIIGHEEQIRFCEWFYISEGDTLVEHGNQQDPYCLIPDPIHPFIRNENRLEVRTPFGNLTTRYLINGMGFFNPHADGAFIMSAKEYVMFFFRYMLLAQPQLIISWLWGAMAVLVKSFLLQLKPSYVEFLRTEEKEKVAAAKSQTTPEVLRKLRELFAEPAASHPMLIVQELWLDRALLVAFVFFVIFEIFLLVQIVWSVSIYWMFIPLFLFLPFFLFYSRSVSSAVTEYKEPKERILNLTSQISGAQRIVYGHTHTPRHEIVGVVEHLNSGTWSPAFLDVECTKALSTKTFVWIYPDESGREAQLREFTKGSSQVYIKKITAPQQNA